MTGSAMPVTEKTGRIRNRLAASLLGVLLCGLGTLSMGSRAADAPAPASAPAAADSSGAAGAPASAPAATTTTAPGAADTRSLDEDTQQLKKDVVDLNRDLFVLEEELLFPANTQVAVYVSMDVGEFFALDSINLKIDNRDVSTFLYTAREADALLKGG